MSSRKSFKILRIPQFFYQHLQITDPFWVSFFFNSRLRQFCHWLLKFLQKSQPSQKNQSQTTDVRFIKTFLSFNIKTPVLVKTCRCPYSNVHSVACWIKKKYIPLSQNSQTRRKQRLPIVVPTTPLICFRVMCAPICKMIKWRKFETVFILIFITDFFILLIYIVSWIAWKYLTKALFIHVCIVLFSRGKRWLVRLNHRGKNDEKCHESMECTYIGESILPVRS